MNKYDKRLAAGMAFLFIVGVVFDRAFIEANTIFVLCGAAFFGAVALLIYLRTFKS